MNHSALLHQVVRTHSLIVAIRGQSSFYVSSCPAPYSADGWPRRLGSERTLLATEREEHHTAGVPPRRVEVAWVLKINTAGYQLPNRGDLLRSSDVTWRGHACDDLARAIPATAGVWGGRDLTRTPRKVKADRS
jgi:hypothetical protein